MTENGGPGGPAAGTGTVDAGASGAPVADGAPGGRRGFFAGVPRPLLALGVAAVAFVIVATVVAFGYGSSSAPTAEPLNQAQIRRLLNGQGLASSAPVGFRRIDRPAPAFSLSPVVGTAPVALRHLAGRPIVVNFWYSTCPPCQAEATGLAAVARATAGRVTFVGVDYEDSRSSAAAFLRKYGETYPNGFDGNGRVATQLYGIPGTPTTFFLSPDGRRELGIQVGAMSEASLARDLRTLYGVRA